MNRLKTLSPISLTAVVLAICLSGTLAQNALAGAVPAREAPMSVSEDFTVPAFGNGALLRVQCYNALPATGTLEVSHIIPTSATTAITNAVCTLTNASGTAISELLDVPIVPGDKIVYGGTTTNANVLLTRQIAYP